MFIAKQKNHIACIGETEQECVDIMNRAFATDYVIEETETEYELYNGQYLTQEEIVQKERERINKRSLTKREVFLALYNDKGITPEQIKAQISDPSALIEFEYATEYFRGNPLIDTVGIMLGYTSEQLDYLFENKEFPNESIY